MPGEPSRLPPAGRVAQTLVRLQYTRGYDPIWAAGMRWPTTPASNGDASGALLTTAGARMHWYDVLQKKQVFYAHRQQLLAGLPAAADAGAVVDADTAALARLRDVALRHFVLPWMVLRRCARRRFAVPHGTLAHAHLRGRRVRLPEDHQSPAAAVGDPDDALAAVFVCLRPVTKLGLLHVLDACEAAGIQRFDVVSNDPARTLPVTVRVVLQRQVFLRDLFLQAHGLQRLPRVTEVLRARRAEQYAAAAALPFPSETAGAAAPPPRQASPADARAEAPAPPEPAAAAVFPEKENEEEDDIMRMLHEIQHFDASPRGSAGAPATKAAGTAKTAVAPAPKGKGRKKAKGAPATTTARKKQVLRQAPLQSDVHARIAPATAPYPEGTPPLPVLGTILFYPELRFFLLDHESVHFHVPVPACGPTVAPVRERFGGNRAQFPRVQQADPVIRALGLTPGVHVAVVRRTGLGIPDPGTLLTVCPTELLCVPSGKRKGKRIPTEPTKIGRAA